MFGAFHNVRELLMDSTFPFKLQVSVLKTIIIVKDSTASWSKDWLIINQYCFLDINIGWPGSVHNARVLANSELFKKGQNGSLFPQQPKLIKGVPVPLLNVRDPTYPLLPWIMKPYFDTGRLSRQERVFNFRLCHLRVLTENALGD